MKKEQKSKAGKVAGKVEKGVDVNDLIVDGSLTVSHAAIAARVKSYDLKQTIAYFGTQEIITAVKAVIENRVNKTVFGNSFIATAAGILGFLTDENKGIFAGDKGKGALNNSAHFSYVSKVYGFGFGTVKPENKKTVDALLKAGYAGVQIGKVSQVLKSKTVL